MLEERTYCTLITPVVLHYSRNRFLLTQPCKNLYLKMYSCFLLIGLFCLFSRALRGAKIYCIVNLYDILYK